MDFVPYLFWLGAFFFGMLIGYRLGEIDARSPSTASEESDDG